MRRITVKVTVGVIIKRSKKRHLLLLLGLLLNKVPNIIYSLFLLFSCLLGLNIDQIFGCRNMEQTGFKADRIDMSSLV